MYRIYIVVVVERCLSVESSDVTVAVNASEDVPGNQGRHLSLPYCTITSWILLVPIVDTYM